ncbi:MAG TPA: SMI1/KNR4 family protein [Myxococcaceae bacterium]|nr:SMI1/KNR4 family protein [Myxococcaceae bacterium]
MTVEKYRRARELITKAGGGDFAGPKPESLVARAEEALGLRFPPSYRQFLLELGCGDVGGFEVYGVVDDDFVHSSVPDAIWMTLEERRNVGLDPRYLVIGTLGDGTLDCLDTVHLGRDGEAPVVQLSSEGEDPVRLADSFGEYFLTEVESALSEGD